MTDTPGLEERVAALEALVAQLVQPDPEFMAQTRVDTFRDSASSAVRLTHLPTGVTVEAADRAEGVFKLRKALAGKARREFDLQEAERRRAAKEASGDRS